MKCKTTWCDTPSSPITRCASSGNIWPSANPKLELERSFSVVMTFPVYCATELSTIFAEFLIFQVGGLSTKYFYERILNALKQQKYLSIFEFDKLIDVN